MSDLWYQLGQDILGEAANNYFGRVSISADGLVVAIGAPANAGGGISRGSVRVFAFNGTSWVQRGNPINGETNGDFSGYAVELSSDGTSVAISARGNDGTSGDVNDNRGHVRVYTWNGSAWVQKGQDIDGEAAGDSSGEALSFSSDGNTLAIGAIFNDGSSGNVNDNRGHVRVYTWNGSTWVQKGQDIDGEAAGDQSGRAVSLSADGSIVAIGARLNDNPGGIDAGHVRVYAYNGTQWVQRGQDIDGVASNDFNGRNVSLSADGTLVAIGANGNDTNGNLSGQVRVWNWNGSLWVQRGQDINGISGEQLGTSVMLSIDGSILSIGSPGYDLSRGRVRILAYNGIEWVQRGDYIIGDAIGDFSGLIISLSKDGSIVAISSTDSDTVNGVDSGKVRVFTNDLLAPAVSYPNSTMPLSKRYVTLRNRTGLLFDRNGQNPFNIAMNSVLCDMGKTVALPNGTLLQKVQVIPVGGHNSNLPEEYETGYMYLDSVPEGQNIVLLF
jgi:hypothetical protein